MNSQSDSCSNVSSSGGLNDLIVGQWRRVIAEIPVTLVWAYDTIAILDDYHDSEAARLPAGHFIAFSQATEESPLHVLCDIDDPERAERQCLAPGRVMRDRPWCSATRLQAVMLENDLRALTVPEPRPSRVQRFLRMLHLNECIKNHENDLHPRNDDGE